MVKLILVYRISDKGRNTIINFKNKIFLLSRLINQINFDDIYIIADNCKPDSIKKIESYSKNIYITNLGNRGSFLFALNLGAKFSDDTIVYFCEDDYYHYDNLLKYNKEIIQKLLIKFSYLSFYDHPDKYSNYILSKNSNIKYDLSEQTAIYRANDIDCDWRTSSSTTLTFICSASTINSDLLIWRIFSLGNKIPRDTLPWELITQSFVFNKFTLKNIIKLLILFIFIFIRKKRLLGVPLNGINEHLDSNVISYKHINNLIRQC